MKHAFLVATVLLFCSAWLPAAGFASDFAAAVKSAAAEFTEAVAAKDAARVSALYAKDAIAFPPNAEMGKGKEAIQAIWKGFIDAGLTAQLEIVETEDNGKLGVEVGKFVILGADGKMVDQGKYVVVWKKEGGAWKMYRDIWNSSMPTTPPPAN